MDFLMAPLSPPLDFLRRRGAADEERRLGLLFPRDLFAAIILRVALFCAADRAMLFT